MFQLKSNQHITNTLQNRLNNYQQIKKHHKTLTQAIGIYAFIILLYSAEVFSLSGEQDKALQKPFNKQTEKDQLNDKSRSLKPSFCLALTPKNTRYTLHSYSTFSSSLFPSNYHFPLLLPTSDKLLISLNSQA